MTGMNQTSVKITYFAAANGPTSIRTPEGIDDFKQELESEYLTTLHGRPAGLGGLYHLAIEFVSNFTLRDVLSLIAGGIAYDLIRSGLNRFLLRPFLNAYEKLKSRNPSTGVTRVGIDRLTMTFADSVLVIDVSYQDVITRDLELLFESLASNYPTFVLPSGEAPFKIWIPVFEDTASDRVCRFRALLEVDEMLAKRNSTDYFGYWGLWYDFSSRFRVYDVKDRVLLEEEFLTRERYWEKMEEKWRRDRESK